MNYWLKIAGALAGVWIVAAVAIHFAHAAKPTAESVSAYIAKSDLSAGGRRAATIENVESMMNRLTFDERQRVQRNGSTHNFFKSLTPAEQEAFLDATLPSGFKQLMDSFNKMDPAKRKQIVERALDDMKKHEGEQPPPGQNDKLAQHVVDQGLRSFYKDANADVKLDLAPLIEQMQKNLQGR
jgi:hypothetical protein